MMNISSYIIITLSLPFSKPQIKKCNFVRDYALRNENIWEGGVGCGCITQNEGGEGCYVTVLPWVGELSRRPSLGGPRGSSLCAVAFWLH